MRDHGGSLARARALFPHAPEPWIDLSTGINPHPYKLPPIPASAWERLPEADDALRAAAAQAYCAQSAANVVAAPGTQILLPLVARLVQPGLARVLSPTYAEHARAARLAGHRVEEVESLDALAEADLAVLVNPNNPDGRLLDRPVLLDLAARLHRRGGLLVVDEAFMDVGDLARAGMCGAVSDVPNLVVLRSFGKFFGLAGLRLGFGVAHEALAQKIQAELGPWAASGPAAEVGRVALGDAAWQDDMRVRLATDAARLDSLLARRGLVVAGGTSLFRFVRSSRAAVVFDACGKGGIYLRRFEALPDALRFGLPGDEAGWERLERALGSVA